jgi:hypothetical protein
MARADSSAEARFHTAVWTFVEHTRLLQLDEQYYKGE